MYGGVEQGRWVGFWYGLTSAVKILFWLVLLGVIVAVVAPAAAQPTIIADFAFLDNRPSDDLLGVPGLDLNLDLDVTDPGGRRR